VSLVSSSASVSDQSCSFYDLLRSEASYAPSPLLDLLPAPSRVTQKSQTHLSAKRSVTTLGRAPRLLSWRVSYPAARALSRHNEQMDVSAFSLALDGKNVTAKTGVRATMDFP
jgi:hypothetical protein